MRDTSPLRQQTIDIDVHDMIQLLQIAEHAFNHNADLTEKMSRDFANYWLCRPEFPVLNSNDS